MYALGKVASDESVVGTGRKVAPVAWIRVLCAPLESAFDAKVG
jgi:hypothetical protein